MKKVAGFTFFLVLITLLSIQSVNATCDDRKSCPLAQYPTCSEAVGECNPPGCVDDMYLKNGLYVFDCAHPLPTPTLLPGVTPTVIPTPTPILDCPLCPANFHWNMAYLSCCKNNEIPECTTETPPSYEHCNDDEICVQGSGCQTPKPTPPEICGYWDFPSKEHCCFDPTKTPSYYCFTGQTNWQSGVCVCQEITFPACATIDPSTPVERESITITISETIKSHTYWVGLEKPLGIWAIRGVGQKANSDGEVLTFTFVAPRAGTYWLTAQSIEIGPPCINKQEFTITSSGAPTPPGGQYYRCKFTTKECILCDVGSTDSTCIFANVSLCDASCQLVSGEIRIDCPIPGDPKGGVDTAIGCIPTKDANVFIKWLLGRAVMIAGGIAFLLMIGGTFMVILSSGNPEQVKAGSQLITSAIAGLVFIIFSLFLLRLIGVEILGIPGL